MLFKRKKIIKIFDPRFINDIQNINKNDKPLANKAREIKSLIISVSPYNWLDNFGYDYIFDIINNFSSDEIVIDIWDQDPEILEMLNLEETKDNHVGFNKFDKDKISEVIKLLNGKYNKFFEWFMGVYPKKYKADVEKLVPEYRIYDHCNIEEYDKLKERDNYFDYHILLGYDTHYLNVQCNKPELFGAFIELTKKYSEIEFVK